MKINFMKASKLWGLALLSIISAQSSFAVVADRFACTVKIVNSASGDHSNHSEEVFVARLPLNWSPAPFVQITGASQIFNTELKSGHQIISANLNFNYDHATKLASNLSVIEARQSTCLALAVDFCDLDDGNGDDDISSCGQSLLGCVQGPVDSWPLVGVVEGTPLFNEQSLIPQRQFVKDRQGLVRGTVDASCQYKGTFE